MKILINLLKILFTVCLLFSFSYADIGFGVSEVGTLSSLTAAKLSVEPIEINLGENLSGYSYSSSFTIKNLGGEVLTGAISETADWITSLSLDTFNLNYNESVTVEFSGAFPEEEGDFSTNISVTSNGGNQNVLVYGKTKIKLGSISGYVLHDETPLPYTEVVLYKVIDNYGKVVNRTVADENAYYSFQELENGTYWAIAGANPDFPELNWSISPEIYITDSQDIKRNAMKGYTVKTIYPKDGNLVSSPVNFKWEKREKEKKYFIRIENENYPFEEIYEGITINEYVANLNPGNYKWCVDPALSTEEYDMSHFLGRSYNQKFKVGIPEIYFQGEITSNTTWTGEVHLTGDVKVKQNVTLTIKPGTIVYIDDQDAINGDKIAINIEGTLIAEGSEENPIKFIPEPEFTDAGIGFWQGIVLKSNSILTTMKYCFVSCANHGVSINNTSPSITYCTFNKCYSGNYLNGSQSAPDIEQNNYHTCNICILLEGSVLTPNVHYNNFYTVPLSVTFGNYAVMVNGNNSGQDLDFTNNYWGVPSSSMPVRIWSAGTNIIWDPALDNSTGSSSWSADLVDWYIPPGWPFGNNSLAKTSGDVDSVLWSQMSNCLGPADGSYFSLGYGGYLVFDLGVNNSIIDSTGDDIIIYESVVYDSQSTAVENEKALVLLSNSVDGPWELAAEITGSAGIDIDSLSQDSYRFIKILDVSVGDSQVVDQGFDLDAIRIRNNYIATFIEPEKQTGFTKTFSLDQNYPNPFNPSTEITFSLAKASFVTLEVFNALGQKVKVLVSKKMNAGRHAVKFTAGTLSSGVYYYKITAGNFIQVKKMLLIR